MLRNHSIHCNNNSIIILFTENFKQWFFVLILVKKTCSRWVSSKQITPTKHKLTIKPWYFRIQQNWAIILQVYITHFGYWFLSKFSHLTARQNKSRQAGKYFVYERKEIISFSRSSKKTTGKLFPYEQPLRKTSKRSLTN